ncbi:MAG: hypothetical protein ABI831_26420, partial [Betaproteobacteria bacterium]
MVVPSTSTITIVAQMVPAVASGVRTATATVTAGGVRFSDFKQQNIQVSAPLSVSVSATPTVTVGDNVVYRVALSNGGSSTALNATISSTLPANTSFLSLTGTGPFHNGCHFEAGSKQVHCDAADIPSGVSHLVVVLETSRTIPTGTLTNTTTINTAGTGSIAVGTANGNTTVVADVPDAPTGVSALSGNGQATVSFTPPA